MIEVLGGPGKTGKTVGGDGLYRMSETKILEQARAVPASQKMQAVLAEVAGTLAMESGLEGIELGRRRMPTRDLPATAVLIVIQGTWTDPRKIPHIVAGGRPKKRREAGVGAETGKGMKDQRGSVRLRHRRPLG